jgi:hypothetical protein
VEARRLGRIAGARQNVGDPDEHDVRHFAQIASVVPPDRPKSNNADAHVLWHR